MSDESTTRKRTRRSFGAVRKLPSGRWQAKYRDPENNEYVTAPSTFRTKTEATDWLATVQSDKVRGVLQPVRVQRDAAILVCDYVSDWINQRPVKESTKSHYRDVLNRFLIPTLPNITVAKLSATIVRKWYADLGEATTATRQAQAYRLLRAALNTAVEDSLILSNPCRIKSAGRVAVAERPVATPAEVKLLAEKMPERYRALILLLAYSGLRSGEALALTRQDVDVAAGTITVSKRVYRDAENNVTTEAPKSAAGNRTVYVPEAVMLRLKEHMAEFPTVGGAPVFATATGKTLDRSNFATMFKRAAVAIGREELNPHDLRHTGAVLAADTGATLKALMQRLGHSTPRAAMVYMHATAQDDKRIADALNRVAE